MPSPRGETLVYHYRQSIKYNQTRPGRLRRVACTHISFASFIIPTRGLTKMKNSRPLSFTPGDQDRPTERPLCHAAVPSPRSPKHPQTNPSSNCLLATFPKHSNTSPSSMALIRSKRT